jgi:hypothetical protein
VIEREAIPDGLVQAVHSSSPVATHAGTTIVHRGS